jgi:hypothetical protein
MPAALSDEETSEPLIADDRNFYKVEKWTKDGTKIDRMLYAGSSLDKARRSSRRRSSTGLAGLITGSSWNRLRLQKHPYGAAIKLNGKAVRRIDCPLL